MRSFNALVQKKLFGFYFGLSGGIVFIVLPPPCLYTTQSKKSSAMIAVTKTTIAKYINNSRIVILCFCFHLPPLLLPE